MRLGFRSRRRADRRAPGPRWSTVRSRPRVLVEHSDAVLRHELVTRLRARGYDTLGCVGPDNGVACPLLEGRPCRAVEQTDAVVTGLVDSVEGRRILAAIHASHPDRPVLVEGTALMLRHLDEQLRDAPVFPLDPDQVADALDARLGPS